MSNYNDPNTTNTIETYNDINMLMRDFSTPAHDTTTTINPGQDPNTNLVMDENTPDLDYRNRGENNNADDDGKRGNHP